MAGAKLIFLDKPDLVTPEEFIGKQVGIVGRKHDLGLSRVSRF